MDALCFIPYLVGWASLLVLFLFLLLLLLLFGVDTSSALIRVPGWLALCVEQGFSQRL